MSPDEFLSKLNEIKRTEYDLRFLINYIGLRPLMFVGIDDIRTVAAFIDGFASSNETTNLEL
jgi:hypothetical protein